jgi:hypothetical protein
VHDWINQLVRKGYLKREEGKARSLTVTKHPQTNAVALVAVPIVGTVAAGHPIFAHEKITSKVLIEASVVGSGKCFALYTLGDSIIDAGINDGDLIIVRHQPISEEVGVGASHILHGDVAEMVSVDNGTIAPCQNTCEYGVTVAMQDSSGPFDRHLTQHLIQLCMKNNIDFSRDVFLYYRSDAAAALEAGNDIRTALICFALDASHGFERTHVDSLKCVSRLLTEYMLSPPLFGTHENVIGTVDAYPMIRNPEQHSS